MSRSEADRQLVLVVDDEPALCHALARYLSREFAPILATTIDRAIEVVERQPDLVAVITDFELDGGRSGRELLDRARVSRPHAARIVVSAALDEVLVNALSSSGLAHRCIAKPWQPAALIDVVRAAVREQLARDEPPALARGTERPTATGKTQIEERVYAYSQPRRHPRYPTTLKVLVRFPTWDEFSDAYTMNLSRGGMLCQMKHEPQVGDTVDLIAQLPGGDRIRLPSTVRHVAPGGLTGGEQTYRVGIQFESLDETRDRLLAVAISRLTGGG